MTRSLPFAFALLALTSAALAQEVCPCIPVTHLWTIKSCDTWDCAASEFNISAGSTDMMVVPTTSTDVRWVVLQRVASGSSASTDPTYSLESFDGWTEASTRFGAIDATLKPMMLSAPDGKFLIVSRYAAEPRRRAVGR